jgi:uncharacterized membrane protein required for colicin V production
MISLNVLLYIFMAVFGLIGTTRGWAKELLVTFGVILSLFITSVLERFIPFIQNLATSSPETLFWIRMFLLIVMVFFGYQTPNISKFSEGGRFVREKLQDSLLGAFLGAINGFLIFGSMWWFMHQANYPFTMIVAPMAGTPEGDAALQLVNLLPPQWIMTQPTIYFAVAIAFAFVLVVFI